MERSLFFLAALVLLTSSIPAKDALAGEKRIKTPGSCPTGIAFDGKNLWVADHKSDVIYEISPDDGKVVSSFPAPANRPAGVAVDPAAKTLFVSDLGEKRIYLIDMESQIVVHSFESPVENPAGLAWDGKALYVSDSREDKIHSIDARDGTTINTIPAPSENVTGLAFDGKYLWAADRVEDEIYMIDQRDGEVINIVKSPGKYPFGIAFSGQNLLVADYQSDDITLVDVEKLYKEKVVKWDGKKYRVEFFNELNNYGPDQLVSGDIYIAVPQSLDSQNLLEEVVFEPSGYATVKDQFGQSFAHYSYKDATAGEFKKAVMKTAVELFNVRYFIDPEKTGKLSDIPKGMKIYLEDGDKYLINDSFIKSSVKEAVGDEKSPYWIVRKIYNHVIKKMGYDLSGGWNAAPTVLKRGSGSCSEYTFVMISMLRAAGIPARYAGSIVVRGDDASWDDVYHRWVEVYLPNYGWIPVDSQKGDKPTPAKRAKGFGELDNKLLITTLSGGGSKFLEWTYNSNVFYQCKGRCKVSIESIAEWEPYIQ
ncbi:MAG: SMP-30/gluconolactonase/LRE family protein [Deltaproteobacteria bacterium]|nr:SMP-30/gluconolactonase/LRE family protein [Deltaproteobacteria bacterium]